jgi:hypothetical protein
MNDREQWVQQRAYALWETEGRPDGRDRAHWEQAERELSTAEAPEETAPEAAAAAAPVVESTGKARRTAAKPAAATASSRRKKSPELRP